MLNSRKGFAAFLSPSLAGLMLFYLVPFIGGISFALVEDGYAGAFVGIGRFMETWENAAFRLGLSNTLGLSLVCAPGTVLLAFVLACALWKFPSMSAPRVGMMLPYVLPSVCLAMVWRVFFEDHGLVNWSLVSLGLEGHAFLAGADMRVPVVVLFVWRNLGFLAIILLSALQALPTDYYDYAHLEGATFATTHLRITFPLLAPTILFALMLAFTGSLKVFKDVYLIGGNYPDRSVYTLQHYMNNHFQNLNYGMLVSAAYILAAIIFGVFGTLNAIEAHVRRRVY